MRLIFYTHSYPYGIGELWKTNELEVLTQYFDEIIVIPLCNGGQKRLVHFIEGITYWEPLFPEGMPTMPWYSLNRFLPFFTKNSYVYLTEFFKERVYISFQKFKKWFASSYFMHCIWLDDSFRRSLLLWDNNSIIYFYWGRGISEILPLINNKCRSIVMRLHGYDLYKDRNNNYIPYQYLQLKKVNYIFPCSDHGRITLCMYFPKLKNKIFTRRIGTISKGISEMNTDDNFTFVSCSFVEKVKRVDIIADALKYVNKRIHWVHIGDGTLFDEIKEMVNLVILINKNVKVSLLGRLENGEVIKHYISNKIDLFINVSESEGVPVSIMEAMAASIPVYATDVGGTGEIVNANNGKLLSKNITPHELAVELETFNNYSIGEKEDLRKAAYSTYVKYCDAVNLSSELAKIIIE